MPAYGGNDGGKIKTAIQKKKKKCRTHRSRIEKWLLEGGRTRERLVKGYKFSVKR